MPNLGEFEEVVLLAVLRLEEGAYSIPIRDEILRRARRRIARGALYIALDRLEEKGLLSSRMGDPRPERGGRPRRYFKVTSRGLAVLRLSRQTKLDLWQGLDVLEES